MDFWWKVNLTATMLWLLMAPFTSKGSGINNPADLIGGLLGLLLIVSWPIYVLVAIWQ